MPPLVHDHDAVAELLGLLHVLRGQDQGDALALQLPQPLPDQVPGLRVQAGGRLVGDDDLRLVEQGAGDEQAALHAGGELVDLAVALFLEFDELQQLGDPLSGLRAGDVEEMGEDLQVLPHGEVVVQGDLLGDDPGHSA